MSITVTTRSSPNAAAAAAASREKQLAFTAALEPYRGVSRIFDDYFLNPVYDSCHDNDANHRAAAVTEQHCSPYCGDAPAAASYRFIKAVGGDGNTEDSSMKTLNQQQYPYTSDPSPPPVPPPYPAVPGGSESETPITVTPFNVDYYSQTLCFICGEASHSHLQCHHDQGRRSSTPEPAEMKGTTAAARAVGLKARRRREAAAMTACEQPQGCAVVLFSEFDSTVYTLNTSDTFLPDPESCASHHSSTSQQLYYSAMSTFLGHLTKHSSASASASASSSSPSLPPPPRPLVDVVSSIESTIHRSRDVFELWWRGICIFSPRQSHPATLNLRVVMMADDPFGVVNRRRFRRHLQHLCHHPQPRRHDGEGEERHSGGSVDVEGDQSSDDIAERLCMVHSIPAARGAPSVGLLIVPSDVIYIAVAGRYAEVKDTIAGGMMPIETKEATIEEPEKEESLHGGPHCSSKCETATTTPSTKDGATLSTSPSSLLSPCNPLAKGGGDSGGITLSWVELCRRYKDTNLSSTADHHRDTAVQQRQQQEKGSQYRTYRYLFGSTFPDNTEAESPEEAQQRLAQRVARGGYTLKITTYPSTPSSSAGAMGASTTTSKVKCASHALECRNHLQRCTLHIKFIPDDCTPDDILRLLSTPVHAPQRLLIMSLPFHRKPKAGTRDGRWKSCKHEYFTVLAEYASVEAADAMQECLDGQAVGEYQKLVVSVANTAIKEHSNHNSMDFTISYCCSPDDDNRQGSHPIGDESSTDAAVVAEQVHQSDAKQHGEWPRGEEAGASSDDNDSEGGEEDLFPESALSAVLPPPLTVGCSGGTLFLLPAATAAPSPANPQYALVLLARQQLQQSICGLLLHHSHTTGLASRTRVARCSSMAYYCQQLSERQCQHPVEVPYHRRPTMEEEMLAAQQLSSSLFHAIQAWEGVRHAEAIFHRTSNTTTSATTQTQQHHPYLHHLHHLLVGVALFLLSPRESGDVRHAALLTAEFLHVVGSSMRLWFPESISSLWKANDDTDEEEEEGQDTSKGTYSKPSGANCMSTSPLTARCPSSLVPLFFLSVDEDDSDLLGFTPLHTWDDLSAHQQQHQQALGAADIGAATPASGSQLLRLNPYYWSCLQSHTILPSRTRKPTQKEKTDASACTAATYSTVPRPDVMWVVVQRLMELVMMLECYVSKARQDLRFLYNRLLHQYKLKGSKQQSMKYPRGLHSDVPSEETTDEMSEEVSTLCELHCLAVRHLREIIRSIMRRANGHDRAAAVPTTSTTPTFYTRLFSSLQRCHTLLSAAFSLDDDELAMRTGMLEIGLKGRRGPEEATLTSPPPRHGSSESGDSPPYSSSSYQNLSPFPMYAVSCGECSPGSTESGSCSSGSSGGGDGGRRREQAATAEGLALPAPEHAGDANHHRQYYHQQQESEEMNVEEEQGCLLWPAWRKAPQYRNAAGGISSCSKVSFIRYFLSHQDLPSVLVG